MQDETIPQLCGRRARGCVEALAITWPDSRHLGHVPKNQSKRVNECIGLKSSAKNTWPRCSYPELTMHSSSQLACSELILKRVIISIDN